MNPMPEPSVLLLILIGLGAGALSGVFGVGGGLIIVPALLYLANFSQHQAIGTSLAVLLLPAGVAGVYEYYRQGNVSVRAALIVAAGFVAGAALGALLANRMSASSLRLAFGAFLVVIGAHMIYAGARQL